MTRRKLPSRLDCAMRGWVGGFLGGMSAGDPLTDLRRRVVSAARVVYEETHRATREDSARFARLGRALKALDKAARKDGAA